jgi:hypothetical protein
VPLDKMWLANPGWRLAWSASIPVTAISWMIDMERPDRHGHATVRMAFSQPGCGACASRTDGTRAATAPRAWRIRDGFGNTAVVGLGFLSNCLEDDKPPFLEIADVVLKLGFRSIPHQQVQPKR